MRILILLLLASCAAFGQANPAYKSIKVINSDSTHGTIDGTIYRADDGLLRFMWGGVHYRFLTESGGITNSALNNELMKSNGTNAVSSGIFAATDGNIQLGSSAIAGNRTISTESSATNANLTLSPKGTGQIFISGPNTGNGFTYSVTGIGSNLNLGRDLMTLGGSGSNYVLTGTSQINGGNVTLKTGDATGAGPSGTLNLLTGSQDENTKTGDIVIATGNNTDSGFSPNADSGNIYIVPGTVASAVAARGNILVGTSIITPVRFFNVNQETATTNAVTYIQRLTSTSSGTPATGIGVGLEFETETSASNNEVGAIVEAVTTDVTSTSEDFDLVLRNMTAGAAATEKLRVTSTGDVKLNIVGGGLYVKEGSNATMGTATLSGGTVVVNTTKVTANSRIFLTVQSLGTVLVPQSIGVTARSAGASFTITSAGATDTSVVAWYIIEPN
jgi:hypothetical protein